MILATDDDEPGHVLRDELAVRLGPERCAWIDYKGYGKDTNDLLRRFGAKGLMRLFELAKPYVNNNLAPFSDLPKMREVPIYEIGMRKLGRDHLKLRRPSLVVLSGPPGHGKTQFATCLAATLALKHGLKGALFTFEDDGDRIQSDLISHAIFEGKMSGDEAEKWTNEKFIFCGPQMDPNEDRDLVWLEKEVRAAAIHYQCAWLLIDPWNEVEHMWGRNEGVSTYLNKALKHLKALARRYNLVLFIVTHPDKASGKTQKTIDDWSLYDIDGGAAWNNKADHGIILFRDDQLAENECFVKVCKSKFHLTMGKPGTVLMRFDPKSASYDESPNEAMRQKGG